MKGSGSYLYYLWAFKGHHTFSSWCLCHWLLWCDNTPHTVWRHYSGRFITVCSVTSLLIHSNTFWIFRFSCELDGKNSQFMLLITLMPILDGTKCVYSMVHTLHALARPRLVILLCISHLKQVLSSKIIATNGLRWKIFNLKSCALENGQLLHKILCNLWLTKTQDNALFKLLPVDLQYLVCTSVKVAFGQVTGLWYTVLFGSLQGSLSLCWLT